MLWIFVLVYVVGSLSDLFVCCGSVVGIVVQYFGIVCGFDAQD